MLLTFLREYSRLEFSMPSVMMTKRTFSARPSSAEFFCTFRILSMVVPTASRRAVEPPAQ